MRLDSGLISLHFKVLVDAPCTNDRESLFRENNNMFSRARTEERSDIPKKQADLLT